MEETLPAPPGYNHHCPVMQRQHLRRNKRSIKHLYLVWHRWLFKFPSKVLRGTLHIVQYICTVVFAPQGPRHGHSSCVYIRQDRTARRGQAEKYRQRVIIRLWLPLQRDNQTKRSNVRYFAVSTARIHIPCYCHRIGTVSRDFTLDFYIKHHLLVPLDKPRKNVEFRRIIPEIFLFINDSQVNPYPGSRGVYQSWK